MRSAGEWLPKIQYYRYGAQHTVKGKGRTIFFGGRNHHIQGQPIRAAKPGRLTRRWVLRSARVDTLPPPPSPPSLQDQAYGSTQTLVQFICYHDATITASVFEHAASSSDLFWSYERGRLNKDYKFHGIPNILKEATRIFPFGWYWIYHAHVPFSNSIWEIFSPQSFGYSLI